MEERNMFPASVGAVDVLVAAADDAALSRALRIAYDLRQRGLKVELASKPEKAGKVRKSADERKIKHAVIVQHDRAQVNLWSRARPDETQEMVTEGEVLQRLRY
jgi:histidyl-tRNA synthetase